MGLQASTEVYGLFAPLLPHAAQDDFNAAPLRQRQGLVPDLLVPGLSLNDGH